MPAVAVDLDVIANLFVAESLAAHRVIARIRHASNALTY